MNLNSPETIKHLLEERGIRPLKKLGQNFLIDENVLREIVSAAELKSDDIVLEIGPGLGTLTKELAKRTKKVIAVEKDPNLARILNDKLKVKNLEVIHGDILRIPNSKFLIHNSYKVVANLPYYIVSPVIRKFLETETAPKIMILMVQKEVAERITAKPPKMSLLAVSVQFYAKPEIISYVSKECFWPKPKVDSAIIKITPKNITGSQQPLPSSTLQGIAPCKLFFRIVKAGFSQPRKQLANNLSKGLKMDKEKIKNWLLKNGVQPSQRAETLSVEDWVKLMNGHNWFV